ncbi:transposase, partial [Acetobacter oeni]|uniref:transposase n=1 Tax=Acetobacter oeni TaxID=304077 RepID=UPI0021C032DA
MDVDDRLCPLSGLGDQLQSFSRTVNLEVFRRDMGKAPACPEGSKGGRPPFNPVLMFRILVTQTLNSLSDERTEYFINDAIQLRIHAPFGATSQSC